VYRPSKHFAASGVLWLPGVFGDCGCLELAAPGLPSASAVKARRPSGHVRGASGSGWRWGGLRRPSYS